MLRLWPLRIGLRERKGGENWLNEGVLLGFCVLTLVAPFFLKPDPSLQGTHRQLGLPPCIFRLITGVPCPFCGATTSFALLARGRFHPALLANPWAPVFYLYLIVLSGFLSAALIRKQTLRLEINLSAATFVVLLAVLWGVKLLVWYGQARF